MPEATVIPFRSARADVVGPVRDVPPARPLPPREGPYAFAGNSVADVTASTGRIISPVDVAPGSLVRSRRPAEAPGPLAAALAALGGPTAP